jgi:hypothetical protein
MADQPKDQKTPEKGPEKPQPETVLLSAEELRNIAGGAVQPNPNPQPKAMQPPK